MTFKVFKSIWHLPRNLAIGFFMLYQKTLSPDHSPLMKPLFPNGHCKYHPSCSEYSKKSLKKHGFVRGMIQSIWRVLRCNPWSKGGVDLP
ncbi:membrane protein insertion efficiency factor YidD [Candidatus Pacearchaeota archaeon]|nr:membrane protein insertion efficiency factor YidD [Candidatus Pacearchaeota archaeon]